MTWVYTDEVYLSEWRWENVEYGGPEPALRWSDDVHPAVVSCEAVDGSVYYAEAHTRTYRLGTIGVDYDYRYGLAKIVVGKAGGWRVEIPPTKPDGNSGDCPVVVFIYEQPDGMIVVGELGGTSSFPMAPATPPVIHRYRAHTFTTDGGLVRTYQWDMPNHTFQTVATSNPGNVQYMDDHYLLSAQLYDNKKFELEVSYGGWLPRTYRAWDDEGTPNDEYISPGFSWMDQHSGDAGCGYRFLPDSYPIQPDPSNAGWREFIEKYCEETHYATVYRWALWDGDDFTKTHVPLSGHPCLTLQSGQHGSAWTISMFGAESLEASFTRCETDEYYEWARHHHLRFVRGPGAWNWGDDWGLYDWIPAYGYPPGQTSFVITYPELVDDRIVLVNPEDPTDPWVWVQLPPGADPNSQLAWWIDGDVMRISYDGVMVLAWQIPPDQYQLWQSNGATPGYYNTQSKTFQTDDPQVGISLWTQSATPVPAGTYRVDTTTWESESGDGLTEHGIRWRGYDILLFGDRAEGGELFQDKYILSADRAYRYGYNNPPFIVDAVEAQQIYDAGFGWSLYPEGA